jgi:hypothetical protein
VIDNLIGSAIAVAALWLWPNRPRRPVAPDHNTWCGDTQIARD